MPPPDPEDDLNFDAPPPQPDLGARRQQIRQMVDARAAGEFQQAHPFATSFDQPPPVPEARYRQAEASVAAQDAANAQAQRAAQVAARRAEIEQRKGRNAQLESTYRGNGQQFYTDPYGDIQPVLEEGTGRPLYHPGERTLGVDRQGLPAFIQRDKYGQNQYRRPPLRASEDPLEGMLYADVGDNESVPYMSVDDALKHPDIQVRRQGMVADRARKNAIRAASEEERKNALAPLESAVTAADLQIKQARDRRAELEQSINELTEAIGAGSQTEGETTGLLMKTPTPRALAAKKINDQRRAQLEQLYNEANAIDESLKPKGSLSALKADSEAKRATFKAQAQIAQYNDQIAATQEGMKTGRIDPVKGQQTIANMQSVVAMLEKGLAAQTPQAKPPGGGTMQPDEVQGEAAQPVAKPDLKAQWAKATPFQRLKMMFGGSGYGTNEPEFAPPAVGSEAAGTTGGAFTIPKAGGTSATAGIANAVAKFISGLTTPENAGLLAASGGLGGLADLAAGTRTALAAKATEAATLGYFTGTMAKDTVEATKAAKATLADPKATRAEKADAIATAILSGAMTAAAGAGTVGQVRGARAEARAIRNQPPPEAPPPAGEPPIVPLTPAGGENITANPDGSFSVKTPSGDISFTGKNAEQLAKDYASSQAPENQLPPTDVARPPITAADIQPSATDRLRAATQATPEERAAAEAELAAMAEGAPSAPENQLTPEETGGNVAQEPRSEIRQPTAQPETETPPSQTAQTASAAAPLSNERPAANAISENASGEQGTPEASVEPVDIGPRNPEVSTGTGVPTEKEKAMLAEQQRMVDEHLAKPPPIVAGMIEAGFKSAADIRQRMSNVRSGPIENGKETILFDFDGKPHKGILTGRNRNLVVGMNAEADKAIATRVFLDDQATPTESGGPKGSLADQWASEIGAAKSAKARAETARFFYDKVNSLDGAERTAAKEFAERFDRSGNPKSSTQPENATTTRKESIGPKGELPRTSPRPAIPANKEEVRAGEGTGANGGNRAVEGAGERGKENAEAVREGVTPKDNIIARSKPKLRADVDNGTRYSEWRIRKVTPEDYNKLSEGQRSRGDASVGDFKIERRVIKTQEGGPTETGEWETASYGKTKKQAVMEARHSGPDYMDAESLSPEHKQFVEDDRAMKAREEAKREQAKVEEAKQRERDAAYVAEVAATPLKGSSREITITTGEGPKKVQAMVYGDWAIRKVPKGSKDSEYVITHIPSGLSAGKSESLGGAKTLVQGYIHSGVDASKAKLDSDALKELANVAQNLPSGRAPVTTKYVDVKGNEIPSPEVIPPARMKPADRIAELEANGVSSVNGKPLKDANAAEIINALGKLRRGQLETPATPKLSDRAIAALQKAKIHKPGQIASADPFTLAYDAAIDMAILAIRAGRAVGEVVKMATQRLKAKHPDATPEQVAKLTADIHAALATTPKATAPTENPSKLPESLKAAGAPAETINYEVRAQDARKQEASDIIKRDGAAKAEAAITDSDLPGDTKVAIGGQLINDKMLSLANAKPEEAARIAKDIHRITAKMQPKLATEAGQTISMFSGIYDDVRTAAAMEYIRSETGKRLEKLGGEEGGKAADEAAKIFNKTKDPATREKEIEKLKERYTTKPVRRMLDQLKRMEVAQKLNDLGVLTRDDMVEIAGNALGIPGISQKRLKHIAELADKVHNAKNHAERSRAELELSDTLSLYKGVSPLDLEASILTLNVLSGPTTQAANLVGNMLNGISQIGHAALANPTKVRALVDGIIEGLPLGATQAKSILATGRGSRDFADKTGGASNVLNTVDYRDEFPKVPGKVADALTMRARMVEKISRAMKAADAVFYYPAREAYARLVATKLLEGNYKGDELDAKVDQLLHTTPASFESARKQAVEEGYEGIDLGRRVSDIIEERRAQTPEGSEAVKQSERFAAESTFNQEPVGLAGVIYRNLARTTQEANVGGVPILKPWTMFLKVPANVFNETTNFTPLGGVRATFGMQGAKYRKGGTGEGQWRNFTRDERNRLYLKSIVGTTLMAGLVARSIQNPEDQPVVSANGPQDTSKRRQLMNAGWKPYSIRVGDKWISYRDSPLLVPLAVAGHVADSLRYNKPEPDVTTEQRVQDAILASPQTIFQTSMLSGLADLMASLSGKGGGVEGAIRTLGSIPANLAIPYNRLLQQVDQAFDPKTYDTNPVVGGVPFVRRAGNEISDVQGRPQLYRPTDRFGSAESSDKVDRLLLDKNLAIPEVGRDVKVGNRNMTQEEHDLYRKMSGQRIRVRLQAMEPLLRGMTREKAQDEVERISREERARVKPLIAARAPMATAAK